MQFQDQPADPADYLPEFIPVDAAVTMSLSITLTKEQWQEALAGAWQEGYITGAADGESGNHVYDPTPNPYREGPSE